MKCLIILALILVITTSSTIHMPKNNTHYKPGYMRIPEWEQITSGQRKLKQKEPKLMFEPKNGGVLTREIKCGIPGAGRSKTENQKHIKIDNGIGQEARPHQFPWQVGFFVDNDYFCSGTIISSKYVLTAAHCGAYGAHYQVIIGAHELMDPNNKIIDSYNAIVPPEWDSYNLANDIAILELEEEIDFDTEPNVGKICLTSFGNFTDQMSLLSGWVQSPETGKGVVGYVDNLPILSKSDCEEYWGELNEGVICIGPEICHMNSGIPLSIPGAQFQQIGIASAGSTLGCDAPYIFTDISKYYSWITSITGISFE